MYLGSDLVPDWDHVKDAAALNPDNSCEVKDLRPWFTDLLGDWAKKFLLFYEGDKLHFDIDNGDGSKRMDLSVDVDWQAFCNLWNDGGIARGIGNFEPSPLSDEMFDERCPLSWDGKKITVRFNDEGKTAISYTPSEFVQKAVLATAHRFEGEFGSWEWIFQKPDAWMKVVHSWEEFNDLLKKPHTTEYQVDQLQRSYDSSHDDFYQTEVKIAFEDGSALYGVTDGMEENYPFIKQLTFSETAKIDLSDDRHKFNLPVPLLMSDIWH